MLTENGLQIDSDALRELLRRADVLTIGFTTFPERLLVDTRTTADEGPMVALVGPVASVQERYLWLGKNRPSFGAPEAFSFFVWPHTVRGMVERDALAPLFERLAATSSDGVNRLHEALVKLQDLERQAMTHAVAGGPGWQTLWKRAA